VERVYTLPAESSKLIPGHGAPPNEQRTKKDAIDTSLNRTHPGNKVSPRRP
jgi:hypothetical protein